jgi:signal recognition particle subunit SRP72
MWYLYIAFHSDRKKTNRESILRKRSKKREAYLSQLASEGLYDPNKTPLPMPDPERWIPKSQRSYNRRGGRGRGRFKSNIGAQGGGAGPGMEKDAAKLDVAARIAAKSSSSGDGGDKQPSTANIKVSSSGIVRKGKGGKKSGR